MPAAFNEDTTTPGLLKNGDATDEEFADYLKNITGNGAAKSAYAEFETALANAIVAESHTPLFFFVLCFVFHTLFVIFLWGNKKFDCIFN